MAARSPARLIAPIALAACVVAVVIVVGSSAGGSGGGGSAAPRPTTARTPPRPARRPTTTYVVKAGDSLSTISAKTNVSVQDLTALNPDIDPQTLSPGQRLKLRP